MTLAELEAKILDRQELKRIAEEAQEAVTSLDDEIKAELTSRSIDTLIVGAFRVKWTAFEQSRIDTSAFKAENPALAARYTVKSSARRFQVS